MKGTEPPRPAATHAGGHLVQLAHGLVDSSFQVIIQFARSVKTVCRSHDALANCPQCQKHFAMVSRK